MSEARRAGDEPIFKDLVQHAEDWLHRRHKPPHYPEPETPAAASPATEASQMSNVLTEVHTLVTDGIGNIKGWAEELEQKLPAIAAKAEQYENSPIVQALEGLVLPPAIEADIANLIRHYAAVLAPPAAVTPPAGQAPAAPAEPVAAAPAAG